jgi:hypothetical protein
MKTSILQTPSHRLAALLAAVLLAPGVTVATTVIGSWQGSSAEGWIDWGNGLSITDPANSTKYSFVAGAVTGYGQSLQINQPGFNQNLAIKLQDNGYISDFMNNTLLTFTFSVPAHTTGGYSQLWELAINAQGSGWTPQPFDARWSATGSTGNNLGTQPNFYFWSGSPARSQTVTLDYSSIFGTIAPSPGWVELIFTFNNGGGAPSQFFINEVMLHGGPIPEPSAFALALLGGAGLLVARRRRR